MSVSPDIQTRPTARKPAPPVERVTFRGVLIVLCSTLATAVYSFTWNSVGVALPHMQGTFSATTDQITWVMIAFVIGSAMAMAAVGWISRRFGRRRVFLWGMAAYCVTLVGCGVATSLESEVFWRFLQGLFGAPLLPVSQAIAVNALPPGRHSQATSLWALGFVAANVVAPVLAGILIDTFAWQSIFFTTLPLAVLVLVTGFFLVPPSESAPQEMDWLGFGSLIIGVGALQLMLARGERLEWFDSPEIIIEAIVAALMLYVFVVHTVTAKNTFIQRQLFAHRDYVLGVLFVFAIGAVLYLPLLLLPLLLQQIGGYPAIETGYLLMSRGAGTVISLVLMSRLRDNRDPRPMLALGLAITAWAAWSMSGWTVEVRPVDVIVTNFVQGVATGMIWAPLNTLALAKLHKNVEDQGYALFYLNFDLGSAIGTAAIIGLHARHSQINQAILNEAINPFNELLTYGPLANRWALDEVEGLAALQAEVTRQATMIAFNNSFLVSAMILVGLIPCVLLFAPRKHPKARPKNA